MRKPLFHALESILGTLIDILLLVIGALAAMVALEVRVQLDELRSKRLQIDDFRVEGWSPTKVAGQPDAAVAETTDEPAPAVDGAPPLLSREALNSLDAEVSVAGDDVHCGSMCHCTGYS